MAFLKDNRLHDAIDSRDAGLIRQLVESGLGPDVAGWDDCSPVAYASAKGWLEGVCLLLDLGADVNGGFASLVSPLFRACAAGHGSIVDTLLASGANSNQGDEELGTCLGAALFSGDTRIMASVLRAEPEEQSFLQAMDQYFISIIFERDVDSAMLLMLQYWPAIWTRPPWSRKNAEAARLTGLMSDRFVGAIVAWREAVDMMDGFQGWYDRHVDLFGL